MSRSGWDAMALNFPRLLSGQAFSVPSGYASREPGGRPAVRTDSSWDVNWMRTGR